jgi:uncharacterized membrane protein YidH (DUF202 family)
VHRNLGVIVIVGGLAVVLVGVLVWSGALSWFGRLPGDIRHEGDGTRVFVPITSSIVASIVLTVVVNLVLRLLR